MNHKLSSEMSPQKIDTSADIIFGSVTLLEGFVILDLKSLEIRNIARMCVLLLYLHMQCQ